MLADAARNANEGAATTAGAAAAAGNEQTTVADINTLIRDIGVGRFHVWLLFSVGMFMLASSTQFALVSFLGFTVQCQEPTWLVTTSEVSLLAMLIFAGMLIGTMFWGQMGDRFGRKPTMVAVAAASLACSVGRMLARDFAALTTMQFLLGVTLSGFGVAFTFFIEFFPDHARAQWSMILTLFWTGGVVLATLLAFIAQESGWGWRGQVALSSVPLAVTFVLMLRLPRSPRYLLVKGRYEEAVRVVHLMARTNRVPLAPFQFPKTPANSLTHDAGCLAALHPRYRRTTLLMWVIWFVCGFTYYGGMQMSTTIVEARMEQNQRFAMTGGNGDLVNVTDCPRNGEPVFSSSDFVDSFVGSLAELPGIALAVFTLDRFGRRATQIIAFSIFSLMLFSIAIFPGDRASDMVLLFLARAVSNTAYSSAWVAAPESVPTRIRVQTFSIAECFSHVGGMLTPFVAQEMLAVGLLRPAASIYGLSGVVALVAAYFLKRDTPGAAMVEEEEEPSAPHVKRSDRAASVSPNGSSTTNFSSAVPGLGFVSPPSSSASGSSGSGLGPKPTAGSSTTSTSVRRVPFPLPSLPNPVDALPSLPHPLRPNSRGEFGTGAAPPSGSVVI